jgi:hypothetical protein
MFDAIVGWLAKFVKATPRVMFILAASSALLLFLPARVLAAISIDALVITYKSWIGLTFLMSTVGTLSYPVWWVYQWLTIKRRILSARTNGTKRLRNLDGEEKRVLQDFISHDSRTRYFAIDDGTVANLSHCYILYASVARGQVHSFPVTIREWAWKYLHRHPELLLRRD